MAPHANSLQRVLLLGLILASWSVMAERVVEQLEVQQPRGFGYLIGDKFKRVVDFRLRKPYRLDATSLPVAGRLTHWLAMETPQVEQQDTNHSTQYRIQIIYQLVNISPDEQDISLPEHRLQYGDGKEILQALVPATRIRVSVISDFGHDDLRPDRAPTVMPPHYTRMGALGVILVGALAGLATLRFGFLFGQGRAPFAQARRALTKYRTQGWDDARYGEALKGVHQAFNATAGKTVFGESLEVFFVGNARYAVLDHKIREFFTRSSAYFYAAGSREQRFAYSPAELFNFVEACCEVERGQV